MPAGRSNRPRSGSARARAGLDRGARRTLDRDTRRIDSLREQLRRGPTLLVERRRAAIERTAGRLAALSPRATLERGYAIVRAREGVVRSAAEIAAGDTVAVELGQGGFDARVEEVANEHGRE